MLFPIFPLGPGACRGNISYIHVHNILCSSLFFLMGIVLVGLISVIYMYLTYCVVPYFSLWALCL